MGVPSSLCQCLAALAGGFFALSYLESPGTTMFKRMILPVLLLAFATDDSARKSEPPTHGLATPYTKTETIPSVDTQISMPIVRKDQRVVTALDSKNLNYQFLQEGKIFRVGFNLSNHRHHFGMIASFYEKLNPIDPYTPSIRRIWAIAYSDPKLPSAETLASLMIESGKRKIGAWEMFRGPNDNYTVVYDVKAYADSSADTLLLFVAGVAEVADLAEQQFEALAAKAHKNDPSFKPEIDKF